MTASLLALSLVTTIAQADDSAWVFDAPAPEPNAWVFQAAPEKAADAWVFKEANGLEDRYTAFLARLHTHDQEIRVTIGVDRELDFLVGKTLANGLTVKAGDVFLCKASGPDTEQIRSEPAPPPAPEVRAAPTFPANPVINERGGLFGRNLTASTPPLVSGDKSHNCPNCGRTTFNERGVAPITGYPNDGTGRHQHTCNNCGQSFVH